MTNGNVFFVVAVIVLLLVADAVWLHWNLPVFMGRQLISLVEYLAFWR